MGNILDPPQEKIKKVEYNNIMNDLNNSDKLIEEDSNQNKNILDKEDYNINDNDNDIKENNNDSEFFKGLPKIHFYEYFFNNIYSKCCKRRRNQELINISNEIIYKYLSIDSLLYNQIKLENLFKDYKWNNPELNNIQNNKMIIKLKNNWIGLNT